MEEYVLAMKRAATPIYPKDACTILMMLDLSKGATVLEVKSRVKPVRERKEKSKNKRT